MKVSRKSLVLAGAALLCAGTAAGAQKTGDGPVYRRVTEPLRPVTLDLQTGTLTRGPRVRNKAVTTCSSFNNNDFSGFVGVDSGAGMCEWWDRAIKEGGSQAQRIGGKTGLMTGFSFAYCSAALDPASFGAGGSAIISFREGYETGTHSASGLPYGTTVGVFALSGLPANTQSSSFFGGFNCYQISVTIGNIPLCYGGDGNVPPSEPSVGWAWQFVDLGTDGVLASTFPFLSCVASCTNGPGAVNPGRPPGGPFGTPSGFDGLGMRDTIDQWCPVGMLLSTFQFGTTAFGGYFTSLSMDVREAAISSVSNTIAPTAPNNQGTGPAPAATVVTQALGLAPRFTFDCSAASMNKAAIFRVGFAGCAAVPSKYGTIWVPLSGFLGFNVNLGNHGQGHVLVPGGVIPKDLTFACLPVSFQGFCGDDPIGFTSQGLCGQLNLSALR